MLHPIRSSDARGAQLGCTQLDLLMQVGPSWAGWAPFRSPPTATVRLGLQGAAHPIHSFGVGFGWVFGALSLFLCFFLKHMIGEAVPALEMNSFDIKVNLDNETPYDFFLAIGSTPPTAFAFGFNNKR